MHIMYILCTIKYKFLFKVLQNKFVSNRDKNLYWTRNLYRNNKNYKVEFKLYIMYIKHAVVVKKKNMSFHGGNIFKFYDMICSGSA